MSTTWTKQTARMAVEDLLLEYSQCLDDERYEEWPDLFLEKCVYKIIPRSSHARGHISGFYYCDSRGMLKDRVVCMHQTPIHEPQTYRHVLNRTRVMAVDGDICRAETNFLVLRTIQDGESTVYATGKYLDTIVLAEDGGSRFREKIVLTDSAALDMFLLAPL